MPANPNTALGDMSDLAIPQTQPIPQTPSALQLGMTSMPTQSPQAPPQISGYMGAGGQVASIADNFLRGLLAGKQMKQQRDLQQATASVKQNTDIYNNLIQQFNAQRDSGADVNSDAMKNLAGQTVTAYNNMHNVMAQYTMPPPDQKKGTGKKVKEGLLGSPIEMFSQLAMQGMQSAGQRAQSALDSGANPTDALTGLPGYQPMSVQDKAAQLQLQGAKHNQQRQQVEEGRQDNLYVQQTQAAQAAQDYQTAVKNGDLATQQALESKYAGLKSSITALGGKDPGQLPFPGEDEMARDMAREKWNVMSNINKLSNPADQQKAFANLTQYQRLAVGLPPVTNAFEAYMAKNNGDPAKALKDMQNNDLAMAYARKDQQELDRIGGILQTAHPEWSAQQRAQYITDNFINNKGAGATSFDKMNNEERANNRDALLGETYHQLLNSSDPADRAAAGVLTANLDRFSKPGKVIINLPGEGAMAAGQKVDPAIQQRIYQKMISIGRDGADYSDNTMGQLVPELRTSGSLDLSRPNPNGSKPKAMTPQPQTPNHIQPNGQQAGPPNDRLNLGVTGAVPAH